MPDAPATPRSTSARRAAAWSRGRLDGGRVDARGGATASPTGRCACPTACAGTCCTCSPRRSTGAAAGARRARRRRRRHLGRRLRAARRRAAACSACRSTTATTRTDGMVERAFERVPRDELYAVDRHPDDADQHRLPAAGRRGLGGAGGRRADRARPRPARLWLSRRARQRAHQRLDHRPARRAHAASWARELIERLGLPARPFGALVEPGHDARPAARPPRASARVPVYAVAGHDTASAFAAAPLRDEHAAILSSGHVVAARARAARAGARPSAARDANLTNERGVDGTTRLLKNVMGLWLMQECRARVGRRATYDELHAARRRGAPSDVAAVRPRRRGASCAPGDMPARIAAACARTGQAPPDDARRDRARDPRLAGLQVPPRARAARGA